MQIDAGLSSRNSFIPFLFFEIYFIYIYVNFILIEYEIREKYDLKQLNNKIDRPLKIQLIKEVPKS